MKIKTVAFVLTIVMLLSALPVPTALASTGSVQQISDVTKTPCQLTPLDPLVRVYSSNFVNLHWINGYEYSMDGVNWQSDYAFKNLQPETEYRFYQRLKETDTTLASEVSNPIIVTTPKAGVSSYTNYDLLVEFIETNGIVNEDGDKTIVDIWEDESGYTFYYMLQNYGTSVYFAQVIDSSNEDCVVSVLEFKLTKFQADMKTDMLMVLGVSGEVVDYVECVSRFNRNEHTTSSTYTLSASGTYLTSDDVTDYYNATFQLMCAGFDSLLYYHLGFGLNGLGFVQYDGMGTAVCDIASGYHIGGTELRGKREPTCGVYGNTGYSYCLGCETKLETGVYISPTNNHIYDNACDGICDQCNAVRTTSHTYDNNCDGTCNVCGTVRTPAAHQYSYAVSASPTMEASGTLSGTCSVCADVTSVTLPKLNMRDYLYSVIKEPDFIEAGTGRYTWKTSTYGQYSFDVELDKLEVVPVKIQIISMPAKLSYNLGETLDTAGLSVKLAYNDGTEKTLSEGFEVSGYDAESEGVKTVYVTSEGMTTLFNVTVGQVQTYGIRGTITSHSGDGDIQIALYRFDSPKPCYLTEVRRSTADYVIYGVEPGEYRMVVSKAGHADWEYSITVGNSDATQDVGLCLQGDVTGDGKVNMKDWNRLYDHINEKTPLTGYAILCADVTGDGKANMKDWNRLYDHINEVAPLW